MHGGGFVAGNIDSEDLINRQICSVCDVIIFSIEYRLAPEHPVVPTILNDVEDGLKWTHANASRYGGDTSESIFISGTSSGKFSTLLIHASCILSNDRAADAVLWASGAAMAATLGFRAESLCIPVKGLILRQPVFIFNTYQKVAKKEWLSLLKSHEENADSPILGTNQVVSLPRQYSSIYAHAHHNR